MFMYMHAQVQGVCPTLSMQSAKVEWGRIYCLVHFHLEAFRVFGAQDVENALDFFAILLWYVIRPAGLP